MKKIFKNRKVIILIIIILLIILIVPLIVKNIGKYIVISKLNKYIELGENDYLSEIEKRGYVNKDTLLKIIAIKDKEYITEYGISDVIIELESNENSEKYYFVEVRNSGYSKNYICYGRYKIDYYTGEEIVNENDNFPYDIDFSTGHMFVNT